MALQQTTFCRKLSHCLSSCKSHTPTLSKPLTTRIGPKHPTLWALFLCVSQIADLAESKRKFNRVCSNLFLTPYLGPKINKGTEKTSPSPWNHLPHTKRANDQEYWTNKCCSVSDWLQSKHPSLTHLWRICLWLLHHAQSCTGGLLSVS